jgi:predicted Rossmann fold nucleotide-binding protein DprA/Smf involved in DNA uptake
MKVAVIGSREITDQDLIFDVLKKYQIKEVISGGARGVDSIAEKFTKLNAIPVTIFKPDWKKFGKAAGPIRNRTIIDNADIVVAFWDKKSRETLDATKCAIKIGKTVNVYQVVNNEINNTRD